MEDFHALYVALTRVRSGADLCVFGDPNDLRWVDDLKPASDELVSFLKGYDDNGIVTF